MNNGSFIFYIDKLTDSFNLKKTNFSYIFSKLSLRMTQVI
jgi:hypothetical protein